MIQITIDTSKFVRTTDELIKKELPFATAMALTKTVTIAKKVLDEEIFNIFDRPSRYTQGSLYQKNAKKDDLNARVGYKERASKYLLPNIEGGPRGWKASEHYLRNKNYMRADQFWVPGKDAKLDKYGNISPGQIVQILAYFRANPFERGNVNTRSLGRRRKQGKPLRLFALKDRTNIHAAGVYVAEGKQVKQLLRFVQKPQYKKRFRFYEISRQIIDSHFQSEFMRALNYALRTSKAK